MCGHSRSFTSVFVWSTLASHTFAVRGKHSVDNAWFPCSTPKCVATALGVFQDLNSGLTLDDISPLGGSEGPQKWDKLRELDGKRGCSEEFASPNISARRVLCRRNRSMQLASASCWCAVVERAGSRLYSNWYEPTLHLPSFGKEAFSGLRVTQLNKDGSKRKNSMHTLDFSFESGYPHRHEPRPATSADKDLKAAQNPYYHLLNIFTGWVFPMQLAWQVENGLVGNRYDAWKEYVQAVSSATWQPKQETAEKASHCWDILKGKNETGGAPGILEETNGPASTRFFDLALSDDTLRKRVAGCGDKYSSAVIAMLQWQRANPPAMVATGQVLRRMYSVTGHTPKDGGFLPWLCKDRSGWYSVNYPEIRAAKDANVPIEYNWTDIESYAGVGAACTSIKLDGA